MAQTYSTEDGQEFAVESTTIRHVRSLEDLTGRPTEDLLDEAVRLLKEQLVPSTRPVAAKRGPRKVTK